jgi:aryl-alcohol dehydrogenase-like predicted oxidoreductase/histidinol phosphatase-like enzyme/predicted kinase
VPRNAPQRGTAAAAWQCDHGRDGMIEPRPAAIGCMRLSTAADRDDDRSIAVLHAALDAGVTLLDTADAYCLDEEERGHNERLIARALSTWPGDRSRITVATKGGIVRPGGRWETDGRARHLTAACEASCRALGVERIDLYQLHAPDPRTPLSTSVRALAALKRDGRIGAIGLCNVTVGQIEEARGLAEIDAIQVELSVWHDAGFLGGVAEYCAAHRLMLLAYRPLGGARSRARTAADPVLAAVAQRHGASPFEIALAWLADRSATIVPIPGVTRVVTAQSAAHWMRIALTDDDRRALGERFPAGRSIRRGPPPAPSRRDAEVVLVMGLPGAGKTTFAADLVAGGYQRLNRDEAGGALRDLVPALDRALAAGAVRIVLDNTYISRASRAEVIRAAAGRGVPVRCVWLSTSVDEAQVNAAARLLGRYGRLPGDDELARLRKQDVAAFLPSVQFRYQRELEPPDAAEGFSRIDVVPFARRVDSGAINRALIVWLDGVLLLSRSRGRTPAHPDDVEVRSDRAAALRRFQDEGWIVLGMSWQPEIDGGAQSPAGAEAVFARMNERLGMTIEVVYCPHAAGPPRCWCRKPLPGLGVLLIQRHRLDPARCIYVGDGPQDPGFARKLGFTYAEAAEFFASDSPRA